MMYSYYVYRCIPLNVLVFMYIQIYVYNIHIYIYLYLDLPSNEHNAPFHPTKTHQKTRSQAGSSIEETVRWSRARLASAEKEPGDPKANVESARKSLVGGFRFISLYIHMYTHITIEQERCA